MPRIHSRVNSDPGLVAANIPNLPFRLETELERDIALDPDWQQGIEWGVPRRGHPEGKTVTHVRDVLHNVDSFFGNSNTRSQLRLIALIHDTFKAGVIQSAAQAHARSHGYLARQFAEQYIHDSGVLDVIELHDEAYKASLLLVQQRDGRAAERKACDLIARLGANAKLYMDFYLCDNQTNDKSTEHYYWFKQVLEQQSCQSLDLSQDHPGDHRRRAADHAHPPGRIAQRGRSGLGGQVDE